MGHFDDGHVKRTVEASAAAIESVSECVSRQRGDGIGSRKSGEYSFGTDSTPVRSGCADDRGIGGPAPVSFSSAAAGADSRVSVVRV